MNKFAVGVIATLLSLSCVMSVLAADVKPVVNDSGKLRPVHTGETVGVLNGGTGSTSASGARTNLSVYSKSEVDTAVAGAGNPITFKDEGSNLTTTTTSIDCVGGTIVCTNTGGAVTMTLSGAAGTVTTTGSPASGNLTKFSGAASVTSGDLSGDVTTSGTLATTIGSNKVTDGMIRQSGALAVVGRSANSTGNVADIQATAASDGVLRESGSTIGFGTVATGGIANSAVTLAKIANASANSKLLGSGASGSGAAYTEITLGAGLTMTGTTLSASGGGGLTTGDVATSAQIQANTADKIIDTDGLWGAEDLVTLTDGATITPDLSTGLNFTVTLGGNRTLASPTNTKNGQSGVIFIVQDGTGSRTLSFGSNWKFEGGGTPTLTTTASAVDALYYTVRSSTFVVGSLGKDYK